LKFQEFIKKLQHLSETKKIIIIFAVVAMVAPILGYFWFSSASYHISKIGEPVNSVNLPSIDLPNLDNILPDTDQAQTADSSAKDISTADWKTYTNAQYGFEIKYPPYLEPAETGIPDASIKFINKDQNVNINWVFFGLTPNTDNSLFDEQVQRVQEGEKSGYEKGGIVRILNNFYVEDKKAITYETIGWPSHIPSVDTIIEYKNGVITLQIYGQNEINIDNLNRKDFSEYSDLENINNQMLSTFKFTQ